MADQSAPRPRPQRLMDAAAGVFFATGALGILILVGLTVLSVVWRYVLRDPIFGVQDISSMAAAVVSASAVAHCATQNSHITVNIMPKHFGRKVRRVTDVLARACGAAILSLAAMALFDKGGCGLACGNATSNLKIPHAPFYFMLSAALAFFALYLFVQIIIGVSHWRKDDPNEAMA